MLIPREVLAAFGIASTEIPLRRTIIATHHAREGTHERAGNFRPVPYSTSPTKIPMRLTIIATRASLGRALAPLGIAPTKNAMGNLAN